MEMCRACLAEGSELLRIEQEILYKYNLLTKLDIKLMEETPEFICNPCLDAVNFCHEFIEKCVNSDQTLKKAIENVTDNGEISIIIKEELKVEYDDSKIKYEHLYGFHSDDDDDELSKLSTNIEDAVVESTRRKVISRACKNKVSKNASYKNPKRIVNSDDPKSDGLKNDDSKSDDLKSNDSNSDDLKIDDSKSEDPKKPPKGGVTKKKPKKSSKKVLKKELSDFIACGLCPKALTNKEDLNAHLDEHKLDVACGLCPQHFLGLPHLYSHRILHIPQENRRCHLCNKSAWNADFLEFHYMRVHNMADKDTPLQCKICTKTCPTVRKMHRHMKYHEDKSKHVCKVCSKGFTLKRCLDIHTLIHSDNKVLKYQCDSCDFESNYRNSMKLHKIRKHTVERVYCKICQKVFKNQDLRDKHVCKELESLVCPVCGYTTKNRRGFTDHKRVHDALVRFKCEQCPAQFRSRNNLTAHKDKHAGKPRWLCGVCQRAFYHAAALAKHRRVHTGEKPFVCEICSKGFTGRHNLKVHMRIHGIYNLIKSKDSTVDIQS